MTTCKRCGKESEMPFHTCLAKPTNDQLKQALAKMLPERIAYEVSQEEFIDGLYWNKGEDDGPKVLDTELLHICWMVEETLHHDDWRSYSDMLTTFIQDSVVDLYNQRVESRYRSVNATWKQRTIALAKVKGIEI